MGLKACAVEPGRRFVTERGKKKEKKNKESRNLNPGLSPWVTSLNMYLTPCKNLLLLLLHHVNIHLHKLLNLLLLRLLNISSLLSRCIKLLVS